MFIEKLLTGFLVLPITGKLTGAQSKSTEARSRSQELSGLGRSLIIMGIVLLVVGLAISFVPRVPWLGKLPGDIFIKKENFSFYFPLGSCVLISLVLSFVLWLFRR